jgi:glycosyltransferase involved in cell wall biosynthesis
LCINNKTNNGPAYSRYMGIQKTTDDEIIIFLDGDDWLFSSNVLEYLNKIYQQDIEMTVGSYKKYDGKKSIFTNKVHEINIIKPTRYHLRSGYAYLWKNMPYEFILDENKQIIRYLTDFNEIMWAKRQTNKIHYCLLPMYVYNITGNSTESLSKEYKISVLKNIANKCQP